MRLTCGVLGFSPQAYYAWLTSPVYACEVTDAYLTNALVDATAMTRSSATGFLSVELERAGISTSERRVWRLCS